MISKYGKFGTYFLNLNFDIVKNQVQFEQPGLDWNEMGMKMDKNGMDLLVGSYGMLFVKIRQIWKN